MDFNDTKEEAKFRKKCRDWLEKNATYKEESTPQNDDFANKDKMKAAKAWQKKKYDAGWAMLHWPKEYGGIGASSMERIIWANEEAKFDVPKGIFEIGLGMWSSDDGICFRGTKGKIPATNGRRQGNLVSIVF